jgi:hypothetical protein
MIDMDLTNGKTWEEEMLQDYLEPFVGEDYRHKLRELNIDIVSYNVIPTFLEGVSEPAAASDLLTWHLLATEGGAYFDMDILFIQPIECLYSMYAGYDTVVTYGHSFQGCSDDYYSIGSMMSSGDNVMFEEIGRLALGYYTSGEYQSAGVKALDRHYGTPEHLSEAFPQLEIGVLPMGAFYAFDWRMVNLIFTTATGHVDLSNTYGIHWYGGSKIAQHYIKNVNEYNFYLEPGVLFRKMIEVYNA